MGLRPKPRSSPASCADGPRAPGGPSRSRARRRGGDGGVRNRRRAADGDGAGGRHGGPGDRGLLALRHRGRDPQEPGRGGHRVLLRGTPARAAAAPPGHVLRSQGRGVVPAHRRPRDLPVAGRLDGRAGQRGRGRHGWTPAHGRDDQVRSEEERDLDRPELSLRARHASSSREPGSPRIRTSRTWSPIARTESRGRACSCRARNEISRRRRRLTASPGWRSRRRWRRRAVPPRTAAPSRSTTSIARASRSRQEARPTTSRAATSA